MSVLTSRQHDELKRAILDYLESHNYSQSYSAFLAEASLTNDRLTDPKPAHSTQSSSSRLVTGLLEKKWTSVIRLQKKILDLEAKITSLQSELVSASSRPMKNHSEIPAEWIPRAPERHCLMRHRGPVMCVAFHPIWSQLASGSEDMTIQIWDYESGEHEKTLKGHTKSVHSLAFDARGRILASCSADLTIKLWDTSTYTNIKNLFGHDHSISELKFVPNSGDDVLLSSSRDGTLRYWELSTGFCKKTVTVSRDWVRCCAVSEDGKLVAAAGNEQVIRVYGLSTSEEKLELRGHEHVVECLAWAPVTAYSRIRELITSTPQGVCDREVPGDQGTINGLYDAKSAAIQRLQSIRAARAAKDAPQNPGMYLISGSRDKSIRLWDSHGMCIHIFSGHDNWVRDLAFQSHGRYLFSVSDDKTLRIWDLAASGRCGKVIKVHEHFVTCLAYEPRQSLVATGSVDLSVKVWGMH